MIFVYLYIAGSLIVGMVTARREFDNGDRAVRGRALESAVAGLGMAFLWPLLILAVLLMILFTGPSRTIQNFRESNS